MNAKTKFLLENEFIHRINVQAVFVAGVSAVTDAYFVVNTQPILVELTYVCMKVNSVKTCLSPLRMIWVPRVASTFSTLCNQEPLVNGQDLFTADHRFTLQWHMDPWVLFQLSEQLCEHWCFHAGGSLSDLQASVSEGRIRGRERRKQS